jgi:hypothetical protein
MGGYLCQCPSTLSWQWEESFMKMYTINFNSGKKNGRLAFFISTFLMAISFNCHVNAGESKFSDIEHLLEQTPYDVMPFYEVNYKNLFQNGINLIERAAKRAIFDASDILPQFKKLVHANGICLIGKWRITEQNPYSGLFKKNTKSLIIGRASTTLSNTKRGEIRGFGFAGKIFPTLNRNQSVKTANFFLIDNLGGTYTSHYSDAQMTNEPKTFPSFSFSIFGMASLALEIGRAFGLADKNSGIRQLYPISEPNLLNGETIKTPKWMMAQGLTEETNSEEIDFRSEIIEHININGQLTMNIFVAENEINGKKDWKKIGQMEFNRSFLSQECDQQLHFQHPIFK